MEASFLNAVEGVAALIVAVAIVALLVSKNAQTPQVIQAAGSAFGNNLAVAEAPVTGANTPINLSYPQENQWSSSPYLS